jgi:predicted alpha/beta-hydrolase family hydrolase
MSDFLIDGPADAVRTIVLAHGAGAGMETPFMSAFAGGLSELGFRVVRFEFPYMTTMQATGRRRPPDREPVLRAHWTTVIDTLSQHGKRTGLIIGGKSLGGRIASMVADHPAVAGLVCLGYPFHPPGKPDRLRTAHLADFDTPALICQGERDPFGNAGEVSGYDLSERISVHWVPDGDHSLKPRRRSGRSIEQNYQDAIARIAQFSRDLGSNS